MQAVSRETAAKVNCVQRKMKKDEKVLDKLQSA